MADEKKLSIPHDIWAVFGDDLTNPGGDDLDGIEDIPTVAEKVLQNNLNKLAGATVSRDESWDEPIGDASAVTVPKEFLKNSDERFAKVSERIRELFGADHEEEAAEAIAEADKIRKAARAVVFASAK